MKKKSVQLLGMLSIFILLLSACSVEHGYYHRNHHHSPEYFDHHESERPR